MESADETLARLAGFPAAEREQGPGLAREALARFTGTVEGDEPRHELLVTHNFLVAGSSGPRWTPRTGAGWASTTPTPR